MATTTFQVNGDLFAGIRRFRQRLTARGLWFGLILLAALVAFELFNFATTEYALQSLFGTHDALGITTWAKVLAIAFCGIDFAGLSRLFTPETGRKEPREIWLLTGAWFLGASMNAVMTWWAVGSALSANPTLGNELASRADVLTYGPIFIAALVWLTRILIIGTFAFAGDHIFSTAHGAGGVVESRARPVGASHGGRFGGGERVTRAEPRAVPKPSQRPGLPERSMPLASSSYAQPNDRAESDPVGSNRYSARRNLFGSGTGSTLRQPAASVASPASPTPAATGFAASTVMPERDDPAPAPRPAPERPAVPRESSPRKPRPLARPTAFDGPSRRAATAQGASSPSRASASGSRASTTRTIAPPPAATRAESAPDPIATDPMEMEYVDLD